MSFLDKNLSSSEKILRQFYALRNITIIFLLMMTLLSYFVLDIQLPIIALSIVLSLMMTVNLYTRFAIDLNKSLSQRYVFIQVLLEICFFSLFFYFSGGATNPFTFLYLIPLAVAAIILPSRMTWFLTIIAILMYGFLLKFYIPLSYGLEVNKHANHSGQFSQHVLGMWFGFFISSMLVAWFISYLSKELKKRDDDIAQAKEQELRNQQMVTLGSLAAGTAHELGTPLGSMSIVADDLTHGFTKEEQPELFESQQILKQQILRCKKILSVLSDSSGESRADAGYLIKADKFIHKITQYCQGKRPDIGCVKIIGDDLSEGQLLYDKTIYQALVNLINNAAESTKDNVTFSASLKSGFLTIQLQDNGEGMSDEQIALAGDVSFSTKPDGMGIGLFLAITTIRRCGGSVDFNRLEEKGMRISIKLPLIKEGQIA